MASQKVLKTLITVHYEVLVVNIFILTINNENDCRYDESYLIFIIILTVL